jgi:CheY-like chemotaxis protein
MLESLERDTQGGPAQCAVRILIVDDNCDSADSLASLLQLDGHLTEVAYSGRAALERAASFRPDVVLLDIGLPDLDGYEVAHRLRALAAPAHMRLVAVTGYGEIDQSRAGAAGFSAHLVKPVDLASLSRLIAQVLAGRAPQIASSVVQAATTG